MKRNFYLDVNILVYFLNKESSFNKKAEILLSQAIDEDITLVVSPLTLDEFLHALQKIFLQQKIDSKIIWKNLDKSLDSVLSLPNLDIVSPSLGKEKQKEVLFLMKKYNLLPRDAYHLFTVITNDIDCLATFDKDFSKVKEVKVVGLE